MPPALKEPDHTAPHYVNTLVHFYRGEMGRMMVWRQRFDQTTNWAVIATGSLVAYAAGSPALRDEAMLINLCVLAFFSFIEARRYRFYDAYRARVRMLEVHFITPVLVGEGRLLQGPWREELVQDLVAPTFKCSLAFALGRRFRHQYFALHLFVLASWTFLVAAGVRTFGEWIDGFAIGPMPGVLVVGLVLGYLLTLAVVILRSGALRPSSSEMENRYREIRWRYPKEP
jgi:uncharacterized membrane protein